MKLKVLYITIIFISISFISVGVYYVLGGFDEIEVYFFEGAERTVIGKEYFIPDDNKAFIEKMDSAKMDMLAGTLKGKLTSVVYQDEWKDRDTLHCFIGVSRDSIQGLVRLPAGYVVKQFQTDKVYKIFMTKSGWVRPQPETLEEIMKVRSIEEGEVLQPLTFELYYEDGSFSIEKWVR